MQWDAYRQCEMQIKQQLQFEVWEMQLLPINQALIAVLKWQPNVLNVWTKAWLHHVTHTHIHTLLNTQKKVQCIVTIRSLWANEAYYLCIDFKRFQRFQSIQALKYWSLSETVVVGAIPHRWLSARLRAKAYRFVKREKETWAKSCTYSTILRVPEAIIFYEDSHLSPIQSKSNAPIHCKSNTRLSFASIFLASICVGCWVLLCLVLRTKDF